MISDILFCKQLHGTHVLPKAQSLSNLDVSLVVLHEFLRLESANAFTVCCLRYSVLKIVQVN